MIWSKPERRWGEGEFFCPFTAVTRVSEPPSDLNIIGGSSSRPGIYEALIPNEGANPHILQRHCNNAMRRSSHAGLGAASRASSRASNINILWVLLCTYIVILRVTCQPCAMSQQIIVNLRKVPVCYPLSPNCVCSFLVVERRLHYDKVFWIFSNSATSPQNLPRHGWVLSLPWSLSRPCRRKSPHLIPTPRHEPSNPLVNFFKTLARKELSYRCFSFWVLNWGETFSVLVYPLD